MTVTAGPADRGTRGTTLAAVVARSFLLQSVWNRRTMQSVGFCYAMLPSLRARRANAAETRAFLERHLAFFNTNPVLASYVLGASAAAEEAGGGPGAREVREIKQGLAGPLGMAGDALFWSALRPLGGMLAILAALAARPWAALVLLCVYDAPHLYLRVRGVVAGAAQGPSAAREVLGPGMRRVVAAVRAAASLATGLAAGLAVTRGAPGHGAVIAAAVLLVGGVAAMRLRVSVTAAAVVSATVGAVLTTTGALGG
jgi:mannose/fructose/N-acetylgalactosamine-specific phosphotransferase system component IID